MQFKNKSVLELNHFYLPSNQTAQAMDFEDSLNYYFANVLKLILLIKLNVIGYIVFSIFAFLTKVALKFVQRVWSRNF